MHISFVKPALRPALRALLAAELAMVLVAASAVARDGDAAGIDVRLPRAPAEPPAHAVSGRITRASDGLPVVGAWVGLWAADRPYYRPDWSATTDDRGRYTTWPAPPGDYQLWIETRSALQDGFYATSLPGRFTAVRSAATVITLAATDVAGLDVALPRGFVIEGTVSAASGRALSRGTVELYRPMDLSAFDQPVAKTTIRPDGRYHIRGLSPGAVIVRLADGRGRHQGGCFRAGAPGSFTPDCAQATVVSVKDRDHPGLDVRLPRALTIVGRVVDRRGEPVCVRAEADPVARGGRPGASSWRDPCGTFRITGLARGEYRIWLAPREPSLQRGWFADDVDGRWVGRRSAATILRLIASTDLGTIHPKSSFSIAGRVLAPDGAPMRGVWVEAVGPRDDGRVVGGATDLTGPRGRFRIEGLAPGRYRVVLGPGWGPRGSCAWYDRSAPGGSTWTLDRATVLQVGSDVTGVIARMRSGYRIAGRITRTDGRDARAEVTVIPAGDVRVLLDACGLTGPWPPVSSTTGRYVIDGLPPGSYRVRVVPTSSRLTGGFYRSGADGGYTDRYADATRVSIGRAEGGER